MTRQGGLCTLARDAWMEIMVAPPELAHPVQFRRGSIDISYVANSADLKIEFFNFQTGAWEQANNISSAKRSGSTERLNLSIRRNWINPGGSYARIRLSAREPNNPAKGRGFGVTIQTIKATMELEEKQRLDLAGSTTSQ